jgi:uncharacterized protein YdeI (YjbR/CyaY-like superfamily)
MSSPEIHFFTTPEDLRMWFKANHDKASELLLGYYKVGSGKPSVTWPQSVDEALCVGWIDGVRRSIDAESYYIRFTPRKRMSYWSKINLGRFAALQAEGRVLPAGLAAFEARAGEAPAAYSFEQDKAPELSKEQKLLFMKNEAAWAYFSKAAPWYRKAATWWVASAKQVATQARRLEQLIEASAEGQLVGPLRGPAKKESSIK